MTRTGAAHALRSEPGYHETAQTVLDALGAAWARLRRLWS